MNSNRLIGIIGSGTMGAGIAHACAASGFNVATLDVSPSLVEAAYGKIRDRLEDRVAKGKLPRHEKDAIVARLAVAKGLDSFAAAECVIEAVPEDLALKRKTFTELEAAVGPRTLLATNTSCLSIEKIAQALKAPGRFLGMHFFNPAPVMKLVEIVRGPATSDQAFVDARAICAKLDKTAVKVKDSPGFIGNRVNRPFYLEALRLLETGESDIKSIDAAIKQVGGFKMGPFELLDLIGLDVNLSVTTSVWEDFGKPQRLAPNAIQQKLVAAGQLGRKSGRGFFDHSGSEPMPAYETKVKDLSSWKPSPALKEFAAALSKQPDRALWTYGRIIMAVINEAGLAADTIALPRDVNLTMELGFNYPEGPLTTADFVGLDIIQRLLAEFYAESGKDPRYAPNPLLDRHVAAGELGEKSAHGFLYHAL